MRPVRGGALAALLMVLGGCSGGGTAKVAAPPIAPSTTSAARGCGAGPWEATGRSTDLTAGRGDLHGLVGELPADRHAARRGPPDDDDPAGQRPEPHRLRFLHLRPAQVVIGFRAPGSVRI